MTRSRKTVPILIAALLGAGVLGMAVWLVTMPSSADDSRAAASPDASSASAELPAPARDLAPPAEEPSAPESAATADSTVVWPVKLELELIRGAHMPKAKDVQPIKTGATARLAGRILRGEYGVPATVTFSAGPNLGRQLVCNDRGDFGAIDLWPGLNEVRVEGPGVLSVRELRLAQNREEQLYISYDLPGQVAGTVYDRESNPLEGVDVELDGQHTTSDAQGNFRFDAATGGERVVLVLEKPGYASTWDRIAVAAGRSIDPGQQGPQGKKKLTMLPGTTLELTLGARVGGKGDAQVILLPEQMTLERSYPWHRISPISMTPGTTRTFTDLPASRVRIRVYHDGAIAEPEQSTLVLREGDVTRHSVRFSPGPALTGVVMDREGRRIENALVTYEVADRHATTAQYFGAESEHAVEREIVPPLAPAVGTALTNYRGEFVLSAWPKFGKSRYLTALSSDGGLFGAAAVAAGTKQIELIVAPVSAGAFELSLDFPSRYQGLPIELSVDGHPRQPTMLPPNMPLRVGQLASGTWRMRASWNGRSLLANSFEEFDLSGDATRSIALPAGALVGQDADTRSRANPTTNYLPGDTPAPPSRP